LKATTDKHAIVEELLDAVFSVQSKLGLYNMNQLLLAASRELTAEAEGWQMEVSLSRVRVKSPETAVKKVGGWHKMAASLRGCDPRSRGTSAVGSCYQAAQ
jgi:hypothetical protein